MSHPLNPTFASPTNIKSGGDTDAAYLLAQLSPDQRLVWRSIYHHLLDLTKLGYSRDEVTAKFIATLMQVQARVGLDDDLAST